MPADIIILAAIAIFVLLRLRAVLGRKMGHDAPVSGMREPADDVVQIAPKPLPAPSPADIEASLSVVPEAYRDILRDAMRIDPGFSVTDFVKGAKVAFEMVLDAFNKDDRETLKNLLSREVFERFRAELDAAAARERKIETTLVAIPRETITGVTLSKTTLMISVAFESEQIQVGRDKTGAIVEGDASNVETVDDEWSFERDLKSSNPNWKIVAT